MSTESAPPLVRIQRWLPYWAVLQADVRQTLRSWVYRTWMILSILAAVGYLFYRLGAYRIAGLVQPASSLVTDLLQWTLVGSVTLIIALTVGSIASERGTLACSILSRGISRYQYFLGKWHARLFTVLLSFLLMSVLWLLASYFLLHEDLTLLGILWAMLTTLALLMAIISCGVTVSAMSNSTLLGLAIAWLALYALSFVSSLAPTQFPSPEKLIQRIPYVLQGKFDSAYLLRFVLGSVVLSCAMAFVGMSYFARRDV